MLLGVDQHVVGGDGAVHQTQPVRARHGPQQPAVHPRVVAAVESGGERPPHPRQRDEPVDQRLQDGERPVAADHVARAVGDPGVVGPQPPLAVGEPAQRPQCPPFGVQQRVQRRVAHHLDHLGTVGPVHVRDAAHRVQPADPVGPGRRPQLHRRRPAPLAVQPGQLRRRRVGPPVGRSDHVGVQHRGQSPVVTPSPLPEVRIRGRRSEEVGGRGGPLDLVQCLLPGEHSLSLCNSNLERNCVPDDSGRTGSGAAGAEALGPDPGGVVAEVHEQVGGGLDETGGAADEAVRREVGGPARGDEVGGAQALGRAGPVLGGVRV